MKVTELTNICEMFMLILGELLCYPISYDALCMRWVEVWVKSQRCI